MLLTVKIFAPGVNFHASTSPDLSDHDGASVRALAQRFSRILRAQKFPAEQPLVLLVEKNVGKVLGHYVTEWRALPLNLVVIDEISERHAQYVRIGRVHERGTNGMVRRHGPG